MRRGTALIAFVAAFVVAAGSAQASFHLTKIREVGNSNPIDYVELQMYASGQTLVGTRSLVSYDSTGAVASTFTFPSDVAHGENQRTILVTRAPGPFPVTPDFVATADDPTGDLIVGEDRAMCFQSTVMPAVGIDCVSWGAYGGSSGKPSPMGDPAPQLAAGSSINRTIAPGCPTLLEAGDDTDDSATDFAVGPATPRNNSTAPTEKPCKKPDTKAPQTSITKKPKRRITKARVRIAFKSSEAHSTFRCKLDAGRFKPCDSPFRKRIGLGRHKFRVAATDRAGNADASPAVVKFRRVRKGGG
jgi:hypothetical protein